MKISFTGQKMDVTDSLRTLCTKKFHSLEKHIDNIQSVDVILKVDKLDQIAEADIRLPGAKFHASARSDDMYKSIDDMISKLNKQAVKHKEKLKGHKHDKKIVQKQERAMLNANL